MLCPRVECRQKFERDGMGGGGVVPETGDAWVGRDLNRALRRRESVGEWYARVFAAARCGVHPSQSWLPPVRLSAASINNAKHSEPSQRV